MPGGHHATVMGDVVDLADRRAAQQAARAADLRASRHPALRFVVGDAYWVAHRRDPSERRTTACGAAGDLTLAPPGVPLCASCYPTVPGPR